jgi:hypothetical protein
LSLSILKKSIGGFKMEKIYNIKINQKVVLTENYLKENGYTNENGFSLEFEKKQIYTIVSIDGVFGVQLDNMEDIDAYPFYVPFGAYKVLE